MSENKALVIFGSTGDLTFTKLLPALHQLLTFHPDRVTLIVLIGRQVKTLEEYLVLAKEKGVSQTILDTLRPYLDFIYMQATEEDDYPVLAKRLLSFKHRYVYLATPPAMYRTIVKLLTLSSVLIPFHPTHHLALEKPFGHDQQDATDLLLFLATYFKESNLYRVDHYLGKPSVIQLPFIKQACLSLSPSFSVGNIQSIDLVAHETIGISTRGKFYEATGALKDMVQSHLLLTLAKAYLPSFEDADKEDEAIGHFLNQLTIDYSRIRFGQYDAYRSEPFVDPHSSVETYVYVPFFLKEDNGKTIRFSISTGKKLKAKQTTLTYSFQGQPSIELSLHTPYHITFHDNATHALTQKKKEEFVRVVQSIDQTSLAYTNIFNAFLSNDQTLFPGDQSIASTWSLTQLILDHKPNVIVYQHDEDLIN